VVVLTVRRRIWQGARLAGSERNDFPKTRLLCVAGEPIRSPLEFKLQERCVRSKKAVAEWPAPIVRLGTETATHLKFPAASIETEFSLVAAIPSWMRIVPTSQCPTMPRRQTWRQTVRGASRRCLFNFRPRHHYDIRRRKDKFTPSSTGRHRYPDFLSAQEEKLSKSFTELASAKPAVRAPHALRSRAGAPAPIVNLDLNHVIACMLVLTCP